jgi:hypothetical protein
VRCGVSRGARCSEKQHHERSFELRDDVCEAHTADLCSDTVGHTSPWLAKVGCRYLQLGYGYQRLHDDWIAGCKHGWMAALTTSQLFSVPLQSTDTA